MTPGAELVSVNEPLTRGKCLLPQFFRRKKTRSPSNYNSARTIYTTQWPCHTTMACTTHPCSVSAARPIGWTRSSHPARARCPRCSFRSHLRRRHQPDPAATLAASLLVASWEVAFLEAHRIFRQSRDIERANTAFLAMVGPIPCLALKEASSSLTSSVWS